MTHLSIPNYIGPTSARWKFIKINVNNRAENTRNSWVNIHFIRAVAIFI
jgi:hypothetical protein